VSFAADVAGTLARAAGIAAAAVAVGAPVRAAVSGVPIIRRVIWAGLLAVFLTPVMLLGYTYADFSTRLFVQNTVARELLYDTLQALRLVPLAVLVLYFAPRPVSREAVHLFAMSRPTAMARFIVWLRTNARVPAAAFGLVFLMVFTDHELASLLQVRNWSVTVFDGRASGLSVTEALTMSLLPAGLSLAVLGAIFVLAARSLRFEAPAVASAMRRSMGAEIVAAAYLLVGIGAVILFPLSVVFRGTVQGFMSLRASVVVPDIAVSLILAMPAAVIAYFIAGAFVRRGAPHVHVPGAGLLASVPGLLGPLVLALGILYLFQRPPLNAAYDSIVPLMLALVLLLLPLAMIVRLPLSARRAERALHAARLLRHSPIPAVRSAAFWNAWRLRFRGHAWLVLFLFWWAYLDLTAAAILAPPGALAWLLPTSGGGGTPISVTLYNAMHYGRSATLSAMVAVTIAAPALVLVVVMLIRGVPGLFQRVFARA
jgi:hypothetical protein